MILLRLFEKRRPKTFDLWQPFLQLQKQASEYPMPVFIEKFLLRFFQKAEIRPTTRDFFVRQGDLTQEYFVYFKENQRSMTEKS
ncbi:MAG: hypothetical protein J6C75_03490 [Oscillospiraceae bacterium]|nr:hypothetical protein [Oscillospiraceae bacterium]